MRDSEAAKQAASEGKGKDGDVATAANTDVRVRALPGPQRAVAAISQRDIQMDGWGL